VTLRKTFAVVEAPKDVQFQNFTSNNSAQNFSERIIDQVEKLHGRSFNHGKGVLAHYYSRIATLRGVVGFPRIRMTRITGELAGTSDAVGSWTPSMMGDYRFVFQCGDDVYFIREKRTGILSDIYMETTMGHSIAVQYEVYKVKAYENAWGFSNTKTDAEKVFTVKIEKKPLVVNADRSVSVITTAKFYDGQTNKLLKGTGFQRITFVRRDWKSGIRSKFLVQNKTKHSGFLIGFFAYLVAWREFYNARAPVYRKRDYLASFLLAK
jgi:hypothetical protein